MAAYLLVMAAMSFLSLILTYVISNCLPNLVDGQVSCPTPNAMYVGNPVSTKAVPAQSNHGKPQTVVVYSPELTIPCTCGVITGWNLNRYDNSVDGCVKYSTCDVTMVVFRNVTIGSTLSAAVVGTYITNLNSYTPDPPPSQPVITITMLRSEWIPVKYGDALGWSGLHGPIVYYDEPCGGSCPSGLPSSNRFLFTSSLTGVTVGSSMTFTDGPEYSYPNNRYYGLRAIVYQGTYPYFTSIPQTISIADSTPVGTVISTVVAADLEPKQTLTLTILRSCPQASYFAIDPVTGDISVNQSLVGSDSIHQLTIVVSDECLTNTSDITILILTTTTAPAPVTTESTAPTTVPATTSIPPTSIPTSTPSTNLLDSGAGYGLIVSAAASSIAAIGASAGVCVFCHQLSALQKQLDHVKGNKSSGVRDKRGDGKFLYNSTDDRLKDRRLRSYQESERKSAERLDSSLSNKGRTRPHERPVSSTSVQMSTGGGTGSPI